MPAPCPADAILPPVTGGKNEPDTRKQASTATRSSLNRIAARRATSRGICRGPPKAELPPIPAKRYFTIGEVSDLCAVKPHVLRYWEQEFAQLKPVKRRGNRRYYQHHEVLLIRRIRDLLYEQGFTINGARHRLESEVTLPGALPADDGHSTSVAPGRQRPHRTSDVALLAPKGEAAVREELRQELLRIRQLLGLDR